MTTVFICRDFRAAPTSAIAMTYTPDDDNAEIDSAEEETEAEVNPEEPNDEHDANREDDAAR